MKQLLLKNKRISRNNRDIFVMLFRQRPMAFLRRAGLFGVTLTLTIMSSFVAMPSAMAAAPEYTWQRNTALEPQGCSTGSGRFMSVAVSGQIIYATDGSNVHRFSKDGTALGVTELKGASSQYNDLAVGPDGAVYVYSLISYGRSIERLDKDGNIVAKTDLQNTVAGGREVLSENHSPVAVDQSGNFYIFDTTDTNGRWIMSFSPTGELRYQRRLTYGSASDQFRVFSDIGSIAVDKAGNLYIPDTYNDRIQVLDASGNYKSQFGTSGSGNGQLSSPYGVAIDGAGLIYVADMYNGRIQVFNADSTYKSQFGYSDIDTKSLHAPRMVTVDTEGGAYVIDDRGHKIVVYGSDGSYKTQMTPQSMTQESSNLCRVATSTGDIYGNTYVIDRAPRVMDVQPTVKSYDKNGKLLRIYGASGYGTLLAPQDVAAGSNGTLYVMDTNDFQDSLSIVTYEADGTFTSRMPLDFPMPEDWPSAMVVDDDTVYILGAQTLYAYGLDGKPKRTFEASSFGGAYFGQALTIGANGTLTTQTVDDLGAFRIATIDKAGKLLRSFGDSDQEDGQLPYASALAVDARGNVYIDDEASVIKVYDKDGVYLTSFSKYGDGDGEASGVTSITVTPSGTIYVVDSNLMRVAVWSRPVAPLAPLDVSAHATSVTSAVVSWTPSPLSAPATAYLVRYRAQGASTWQTLTVNDSQTSVAIDGLDPGITYEFIVSALNDAGQSSDSAVVEVKTPANAIEAAIGNASDALASTGTSVWMLAGGATIFATLGAVMLIRRRRRSAQ